MFIGLKLLDTLLFRVISVSPPKNEEDKDLRSWIAKLKQIG